MAGGIRSGRFQKDEDGSNLKSAPREVKDSKGPSSLSSSIPDSPNLRRSARETPAKQKSTLNPSPHKSGTLEKQTLSSSLEKKKSERLDKKSTVSPLRRSGRIERNGVSSSSSSKISSNSSISNGTNNKKEEEGKLKVAGPDEESEDIEIDTKSSDLSKKRKRLDFPSYRSFLRPLAKRATSPAETGTKHQKEDEMPQDDISNSGADDPKETRDVRDDPKETRDVRDDPKETRDVRDDCHSGKVHELKLSNQCCEVLVEGPSSVSRELMTLESKNKKVFSTEANEAKDERDSTFPKSRDSSSQSSPIMVTNKENHITATEIVIDGEGDRICADRVDTKELITSEPIKSASEETPPVVCGASGDGNTIDVPQLDKDISVNGTSIGQFTSVSPSGTKNKNMEQNACDEFQRVQSDLPNSEMFSCNSEERRNLSASSPEALQVKKNPFHKLLRLPDGLPPGLNDHLDSVNQLREFWHRSQNAVFAGEKERIVKSILFILALQSPTCRPFLVISTKSSISVWESEFAHLAPNVNLVIYSGNKDDRKMIRDVQFYEEGGCVKFQILLSHPNAVVEDIEALDCIGWEAMVLDECQNSRISKHFEKLKHLYADFRLLLLSGQLKDSLAEYLNLLSFLDPGEKENYVSSMKFDSKDTVGALAILKERLAQYLAYERNPDSSKFIEFWVPVRLSNVQLEQYCATLFSNSIALRSCSKIDHVGALREILISTRKCCDHPYIVDPSLQSSLTKDLAPGSYLDIGVNVSGKLLLLDKLLQEMKNQGLRVLILFQQSIGGSGRYSIGDILDDFLRQRFGADSYERVDGGLLASKKQAALNMFNDKAKGRFIFLIENRACLSSIKLASVDAAVIFDSDWNPLNDLRALQRITIESQFDQVKVLRLYTACTVEEKVLVCAKQDMILESNIPSVNPSVSHSLLSWGASYLFSKLDEFHQQDKLIICSETSTDKTFLDNVVSEVLAELSDKGENNDCHNCAFLIKAQHSGVSYSRNIILVGEKEGVSSLDKDPSSFWSSLFEGRYPRWRYISQSSQRSRRKAQNLDEFAKVPGAESAEGMIKRRKVASGTLNPVSFQTSNQDKKKEAVICNNSKVHDNLIPSCGFDQSSHASPKKTLIISSIVSKESDASPNQPNARSESTPRSPRGVYHLNGKPHERPMSNSILELPKPYMAESEGRDKLCNSQRDLHLMLKPELSNLCGILKLSEDVKSLAERFLDYLMTNHHVSREPASLLQAFMLALCWRAASLLKHTMDRKESLSLAKKYLNFECDEDQACSVYLKLRILKKKFSFSRQKDDSGPSYREDQSFTSTNGDPKETSSCLTSKPVQSYHLVSEGDKPCERSGGLLYARDQTENHVNGIGTPAKIQENIVSLKGELLKKQIDLIEKICCRREEHLNQKQQVKLSDFNKERDEEKVKLKKTYGSQLGVKDDRLKLLQHEFSQKMAAFEQHLKFQRRKLAIMQTDERNKERQIKERWLEEAKAGKLVELFDDVPLSDSQFMLEGFLVNEETCEGPEINAKHTSELCLDHPCHDVNPTGLAVPMKSIVEFSENPQATSNGISTGIHATVSPRDLTAEIGCLATHLPGEAVGLLNEKDEEILGKTEASASYCKNITEVEIFEPTEASLENSGTALPGLTGKLPIENVSSMSHLNVINAEGNKQMFSQCNNANMVERFIPIGISTGEAGGALTGEDDSSVETQDSASQCKSIIQVEPTEPVAALLGMSDDLPSQSNVMNAEGNMQMLSQSNNMNELPEPSEASLENPVAALPGRIGDSPMGTVFSASHLNGMNAEGNRQMYSSITTIATEIEQSICMDASGSPCLIFSLESGNGVPSLANAPEETNQASCENEHERLVISAGMETDQAISIPPQIAVPGSDEHEGLDISDGMGTDRALSSSPQMAVSAQVEPDQALSSSLQMAVPAQVEPDQALSSSLQMAVPAQVEQIEHNEGVSDTLDQMPQGADIQLTQHSPVKTTGVPTASEVGPSYQNAITNKQTDVQQSIVDHPVQVGLSDRVVSHCDAIPLPNSATTPGGIFSGGINSNHIHYTTHGSDISRQQPAPTESEVGPYQNAIPNTQTDVQQSIVDHPVQVGLSDRVVSHCDAFPLSNSATTPGGIFSEGINSNHIHYTTHGSDISRQQPALNTNLLVAQGNQVIPDEIRSFQFPSSTLERTGSGDLGNTHFQTTRQTEVAPLPTSSSEAQVEQSDQFVSHDMAAAGAGDRYSGVLSNTSHQIPCSTHQTEMQQTIEAANVQVDQSNLLNPQSVVHPTPILRSNTIVQLDCGSQFLQNMASSSWIPPQGPLSDPLNNELAKIHKQKDLCLKLQEDKKLRLRLQCNIEIDMVKRKYDALLQEADDEFHRDSRILDTVYNKVEMNRILADQFRARFFENKGGASSSAQGTGTGSRPSYVQHLLNASRPPFAPRPASASPSTLLPNLVIPPPVVGSVPAAPPPVPVSAPASASAAPPASSRHWMPTSAVSSFPSAPVTSHNSSSALQNTPARPQFTPTLPSRASLEVGNEPRYRPPHLSQQRSRPQPSMPAQDLLLQVGGSTNVQQPSATSQPVAAGPSSAAMLPPRPAPVAPGSMPLARGVMFPDTRDSNVGAERQLFEPRFSANTTLAVLPPRSTDAMRMTTTSDVVCISDDDDE